MNVKKIIKDIIGLGTVAGVAYLAYKVGECNSEMNERVHTMADVGDDNSDYYDSDELDDDCIAPSDRGAK